MCDLHVFKAVLIVIVFENALSKWQIFSETSLSFPQPLPVALLVLQYTNLFNIDVDRT